MITCWPILYISALYHKTHGQTLIEKSITTLYACFIKKSIINPQVSRFLTVLGLGFFEPFQDRDGPVGQNFKLFSII